MPQRLFAALLAAAALVVPAHALAAPEPTPPIPESITLPTKVVGGESATGTVCLDQVVSTDTEVLLFSDNTFLAEVQPSAIVPAGQQCAAFTVTTYARFPTTESVIISAYANGTFADQVLYVIPYPGVDLITITKAASTGTSRR